MKNKFEQLKVELDTTGMNFKTKTYQVKRKLFAKVITQTAFGQLFAS